METLLPSEVARLVFGKSDTTCFAHHIMITCCVAGIYVYFLIITTKCVRILYKHEIDAKQATNFTQINVINVRLK